MPRVRGSQALREGWLGSACGAAGSCWSSSRRSARRGARWASRRGRRAGGAGWRRC